MSRNPRRFDYERMNMAQYERQYELDLAAAEEADRVRAREIARRAAQRRLEDRLARRPPGPGLAAMLGHSPLSAHLRAQFQRESLYDKYGNRRI